LDVDFPPVENGVDYLLSVAGHLTSAEQPRPRDLKYAVLHLQAAAEVLLKTRLQLEHWSLVFKEPGQATRKKFEAGAFDSCTTSEAIARLKDIAGVAIDDKPAKSLAILSRWRNALQHYGLKANARAVDSRAAQVLDFLITFVHEQLVPALPPGQADTINVDLETIGEKLRTIESFIDTRLTRLGEELKDNLHRTVQCPTCDQWTLLIGDGKATCRFCHGVWDPTSALDEWSLAQDLPEFTVVPCPECSAMTLLLDHVWVAAGGPQETCSLCFGCGTQFTTVAACGSCGDSYTPDENDLGLCGNCLTARIDRF
jgi:hypothetical protein